jgi:hypothetical protein
VKLVSDTWWMDSWSESMVQSMNPKESFPARFALAALLLLQLCRWLKQMTAGRHSKLSGRPS